MTKKSYYVYYGDERRLGAFYDRRKAAASLISVISDSLSDGTDPTKWHIREVEETEVKEEGPKDVPELISDIDDAEAYLGAKLEAYEWAALDRKTTGGSEAIGSLTYLAAAWNKADCFKPDWEEGSCQVKFYPMFGKEGGKWEFFAASSTNGVTALNSNICFKSEERAKQFGEQFIDLFRRLLK